MAEMIPGDQGAIRVIQITAPGAGMEIAYTQEAAVRWRIISLKCLFTADATVVDRLVNLVLLVGLNVVLKIHIRDDVTAGQAWEMSWFSGGLNPSPSGGRVVNGCLPERLVVNNQMIIGTETTNMQAGDAYTAIYLIVEEWIEPLA